MRRVVLGGVLLLVLLAFFYVAWPGWTAYAIRRAIEANDPAALERQIDFPSVRERLKPFVTAELDRSLERLKQGSGGLGAIAGQLKDALGPKLANAAVDTIMTPANIVTMVRQGKDIRRVIREVAGDRTGKAPPSPAPTEVPSKSAEPRPHRLGLANVKSYRITGPLSIAVGVAHDREATEPDVTAELAFTGGDWKVVGLVPRL